MSITYLSKGTREAMSSLHTNLPVNEKKSNNNNLAYQWIITKAGIYYAVSLLSNTFPLSELFITWMDQWIAQLMLTRWRWKVALRKLWMKNAPCNGRLYFNDTFICKPFPTIEKSPCMDKCALQVTLNFQQHQLLMYIIHC